MNPLTLEIQLLLSLVAEGRVLGTTWEQLASELKRPVTELQTLKFLHPEEWAQQMRTAHEEYQQAGVNRAIRHLGELMASDDLKLKEKATATMARLFATQERAEQRRLKERLALRRPTPSPEATIPAAEPTAPVNVDAPPAPEPVPVLVADEPHAQPMPQAATTNPRLQPTCQPTMPTQRRDRNGLPLLC